MPWTPVVMDPSFLETGGGSVRIAEGHYLFKFSKIVPSRADYEGTPYFRFDLVATDGPDPVALGQRLSYIATFKEGAQFNFGTILQAFGVKLDAIKDAKFDTYATWTALAEKLNTGLANKPIGGTVIDNSYNGKINSKINNVWNASEWAERKSAVVAPSVDRTNGASSLNGASTNGSTPAAFLSEVDSLF